MTVGNFFYLSFSICCWESKMLSQEKRYDEKKVNAKLKNKKGNCDETKYHLQGINSD
jgi:hypothetical protein